MAIEATSGVPASIRVGDTAKFSLTYPSFPASGWDLSFFVGSESVEAAEAGAAFEVTIPAATTKKLRLGIAPFLAQVTNAAGEVQTAQAGTIQILASIAVASEKSWAAQTLAQCEAAILKISGGSNERVNINGQEYWKRNLKDLMDFRDRLRQEVRQEQAAAGGTRNSGGIGIRFKQT